MFLNTNNELRVLLYSRNQQNSPQNALASSLEVWFDWNSERAAFRGQPVIAGEVVKLVHLLLWFCWDEFTRCTLSCRHIYRDLIAEDNTAILYASCRWIKTENHTKGALAWRNMEEGCRSMARVITGTRGVLYVTRQIVICLSTEVEKIKAYSSRYLTIRR